MYQIQQNRDKVFSMRCRKVMRVLIENKKSLCDQNMFAAFSKYPFESQSRFWKIFKSLLVI